MFNQPIATIATTVALLALTTATFADAQTERPLGDHDVHTFESNDSGKFLFGESVAVGDLTNDGVPDVAIGVVDVVDKNNGYVCVVEGPIPADSAIEDLAGLCEIGNVAANAVRIDRPQDDFVCVGGTDDGEYCGASAPFGTCFDGSCTDRWNIGAFGAGVAIGNLDCNSSGFPALVLGDPLHAERNPGGALELDKGAILVATNAHLLGFFLGSQVDIGTWPSLRVYQGASAGDQLGYPAVGDLDGDGNLDLIAGAPGVGGTDQGVTYALGSASSTTNKLCGVTGTFNNVDDPLPITDGDCGAGPVSCTATHTWTTLGAWRSGTGLHADDVNDDGDVDLLLGAPGRSGGSDDGVVFIQHGPIAEGVYTFLVTDTHGHADVCIGCGGSSETRFGYDLATHDCNGDGKPELLVGAPDLDSATSGSGGVYSFLGGSYDVDRLVTFATHILVGDSTDDGIGRGVDAADGLVGAPGSAAPAVIVSGYNLTTDDGGAVLITDPCDCVDAACDDGDPCTADACTGDATVCESTPVADGESCADGSACNGDETCQAGVCTAGTPADCSDGVACTTDFCFEAPPFGFGCLNAPNPAACPDDGAFCNGEEYCDVDDDCSVQNVPDCNDGFACTADSCDEDFDTCINAPNDAACDDGAFCTGVEVCNQFAGCIATNVPDCDDGVACTADSCNEVDDECKNAPDDGACDDGVFCNGTETCDIADDCQAGTDPCAGGGECADTCNEADDDCFVDAGTVCTDDGLYCNGDEQCDGAGSCVGDGDPCEGLGTCILCNEDGDSCDDTDPDVDLICAPEDNCADEFNPDQLDSDCTDDAFFLGGCCDGSCTGGVVPIGKAGCCDGGDVCDACPAVNQGLLAQNCIEERSGGVSIGPAGGTFVTEDGCVTMTVPPGAVAEETSFSITGRDQQTGFDKFKVEAAAGVALRAALRPEDALFPVPVEVTFCWDDRVGDDFVDKGVCVGGVDDGLTCSKDDNCDSLDCSANSNLRESRLRLKKNSVAFSTNRCEDHLPGSGCEAATVDCGADPEGVVAKCCDMDPMPFEPFGRWGFDTCGFSEGYLGETAGDLIPGKGSAKTDCIAEWAVNNPQSDSYFDKKGFVNFKQTCTDGDPVCDADGTADGRCTFEVGVCVNLDDARLVDKSGASVCTATDVASWEIKKPKPTDSKSGAAGVALRDAVAGLGASSIVGDDENLVLFSPELSGEDACSALARIAVPLRGASADRKGKLAIKAEALTGPDLASGKATKDGDKLKLTCLPPTP